jgi:hypothetical protein
MIIGIDNGLDGGAVALSASGAVIQGFVMPTLKIRKVAKSTGRVKTNREIDSIAFLAALDLMAGDRLRATVIFEECPHHSKSKSAMRGMGINAGKILGVLETRHYNVRRIMSSDWQPAILGKVPQGKTKEAALNKAREIWPDETWTHGKKDWHSGYIDAALIAEYGRLKNF